MMGSPQLAPLSRAPHDFLSSLLAGQEGQTEGPQDTPPPTQAALLRLGLKFCLGTRPWAAGWLNLGDCPTVTKVHW